MNKVLETNFRRALPKLQTGGAWGNKDGGLRHRGMLVKGASRKSKRKIASSVVIPGRSKGVSSNPETFFTPVTKDGKALQLSLQLPGYNGWEYGVLSDHRDRTGPFPSGCK